MAQIELKAAFLPTAFDFEKSAFKLVIVKMNYYLHQNNTKNPYIGDFTMKRKSLKRNIFLSLILLPYLSAPLIAMDIAALNQEMKMLEEISGLDESEREYIEQATKCIHSMISELLAKLNTLKTKESVLGISEYTKFFDQKVSELDKNIIEPLKNRLNNNQSKPVFNNILKIINDVLTEIRTQLLQFRKTITDANNRKKALDMAKALLEQKNKLASKFDYFDQQLNELHKHMISLGFTVSMQEVVQFIRKGIQTAKIEHAKPLSNVEKAKIVSLIDAILKKG